MHWQKLGQFRKAHPAVGGGVHQLLQANPYVFSRVFDRHGVTDRVVVALGTGTGSVTVPVAGVFGNGTWLRDDYSGAAAQVANGTVTFATSAGLLLLAETPPPR